MRRIILRCKDLAVPYGTGSAISRTERFRVASVIDSDRAQRYHSASQALSYRAVLIGSTYFMSSPTQTYKLMTRRRNAGAEVLPRSRNTHLEISLCEDHSPTLQSCHANQPRSCHDGLVPQSMYHPHRYHCGNGVHYIWILQCDYFVDTRE